MASRPRCSGSGTSGVTEFALSFVWRSTKPNLELSQLMVDDVALNAWFCATVLPLEPALTRFIRHNWRIAEDVTEMRQDIYERVLIGGRQELPTNARAFVFTVARNHLINQAVRGRIVSFDLVADLEAEGLATDLLA